MSQTMSRDASVSQHPANEDKPFTILASGAIGAFCFSIADLISNDEAAALVKVGDALRRLSASWMPMELLALIILTTLGFLLCWIYQPKTRLDAFMRGFSVFAIFTVASPYENAALQSQAEPLQQAKMTPSPPRQKETAEFSGLTLEEKQSTRDIHSANDQGRFELPQSRTFKPQPKLVLLSAADKTTPVTEAIITLRDPKTRKIIGKFKTGSRFHLPEAKPYLIEIEAPGYRWSVLKFSPNARKPERVIYLDPDRVPAELQRFYGPKRINLMRDSTGTPRDSGIIGRSGWAAPSWRS